MVAVTGPEIEAPVCETVHVILPGPVESDADPEYVPLKVTIGVLGEVVVEDEPPEPPHATPVIATSTATVARISAPTTL